MQGALSELNLDQPLYIGGLPDGIAANNKEIAAFSEAGLNGAIQRIVVNGEVWDDLLRKATTVKNVPEYGGKCLDGRKVRLTTCDVSA